MTGPVDPAVFTCATCEYFVPVLPKIGQCRRHSPAAVTGWPTVAASDACGDHALDLQKVPKIPRTGE